MRRRLLITRLLAILGGTAFIVSACPSAWSDTFKEAYERGQAQQACGDDEGAISSYLLAAAMAPDSCSDARIKLARLYARLGRYAEAEAQWQQILSHTQDRHLNSEFALFLINQGKFSQAIGLLNDLISRNPNDAEACYLLGVCQEGTDNIDLAKDYYNRAVSLSPNGMAGLQASEKLARLEHASEAAASGKFFPIDPNLGSKGFGWWDLHNMPIHVYIDDGSGAGSFRPGMRSHVLKALEVWSQASRGKISFICDPPDTRGEMSWKEVSRKLNPLALVNGSQELPEDPIKAGIHVHWISTLPGALGLAWPDTYKAAAGHEHVINHAHIWLRTNCLADGSLMPTSITAANAALLDRHDRVIAEVAIHEFGHALGLPHSSHPRDVMCAGIFSLNSNDLLEGRALSAGDLGSLSEHYNNFAGSGIPAEFDDLKSAHLDDPPGNPGTSQVSTVSTDLPEVDSEEKQVRLPEKTGTVSAIDAVVADIGSKRYAEGLNRLKTILQQNPENARAYYLRGVIYVLLRSYAEAARNYREVIRLSPGSELSAFAARGLQKIGH